MASPSQSARGESARDVAIHFAVPPLHVALPAHCSRCASRLGAPDFEQRFRLPPEEPFLCLPPAPAGCARLRQGVGLPLEEDRCETWFPAAARFLPRCVLHSVR